MQSPGWIAQPPRRLVAGDSIEPAAGRYRRRYDLCGQPGTTLLQQVWAEVVFLERGEPRVVYRGTYGEFFRLGDIGTHPDRHDFDIRRDGWTRNAVGRLLRRHASAGVRPLTTGPFEVVVRKHFMLGLGELEGTGPSCRSTGFGLLEHGPLWPVHAELKLTREGDEQPHTVPLPSPFPHGKQGRGQGRFIASRGWSIVETLRHQHIARTGSFEDGGGYQPGQRVPMHSGLFTRPTSEALFLNVHRVLLR